MSKLHVMQIGGYLKKHLDGAINMDDYANHPDPEQTSKAFLTRALGALAVSLLTDAPMEDLCRYVTDGTKDAATALNPDAVAKAMVPVRIISSANSAEEFSSEVTRCTNTQNAIEKRDFVALDPEQERIRQELQIEGVQYAYKAGTANGTAGPRFDLTEATVALACVNPEVTMAVQAKREISKLWEDIAKAPYKQLFNKGVTGPSLWQIVQALRAVDLQLQLEAKKHSGRDALICVHGNRFIQWAALRALGLKAGDSFSNVAENVPKAVEVTVDKVIACIKAGYADSYPASLFKNLGKCKMLAAEVV